MATGDPRTMEGKSAAGMRALGYRLLGSRFDFILHLRPAEWPIMAGHTLLGAVVALGAGAFLRGEQATAVVLGLLLWVVALNGGTLAINSAFDRDEGDVAYLRRPPPPPRGLLGFGMSLMAAGLALAAAFLPGRFVALYATCLLMSVAYSVPPVRLKAVAGADWVINLAGFGTLTFLAGWASTARSLTTAGLLLALGFGALFAALYPLTQLYQFDEDLGRGDHTFALALGKKRSLGVALLAVLLAFSLFGWAGASGVRGPRALVLAGALGVALTAWLLVLLPWYRRAEVMSPSCHQRGMHWALGAWAVTDLAVLAGFA